MLVRSVAGLGISVVTRSVQSKATNHLNGSLFYCHEIRMVGLFLRSITNLLSPAVQNYRVRAKYIQEGNESQKPRLDVGVAERSTHGAHRITNSDVSGVGVFEGHNVGELGRRSGGVTEGDGSVDGVSPFRGVYVLP